MLRDRVDFFDLRVTYEFVKVLSKTFVPSDLETIRNGKKLCRQFFVR